MRACLDTEIIIISDLAKHDVSTFSVYKEFNGHLECETFNGLDSFERSIDNTKIVPSECYSQCWSNFTYFPFEGHSKMGKRSHLVSMSTNASLIEVCSEYFKVFWKTETHNKDTQTISVPCSHSCSRSSIQDHTSDFGSRNDFNNSCRQYWVFISSEPLTTFDKSFLKELQSGIVASCRGNSTFSEEQVNTGRTYHSKKFLACLSFLHCAGRRMYTFHPTKQKDQNSYVFILAQYY